MTVTKTLMLHGEEIAAENQSFYVAVFYDDGFSELAMGPVEMGFVNDYTVTVLLTGLEPGQTYFVCETDAEGNMLENGVIGEADSFTAHFPTGHVLFVDEQGNGSISFDNEFHHLPMQFYWPFEPDETEAVPQPTSELTASPEPVASLEPSPQSATTETSDPAPTQSPVSADAVQTADETPIMYLVVLLLISAQTLGIAGVHMYRRKRR